MKITIDTDRGLFIVPNTFFAEIEKQNKYLKKAGVPEEKFNTAEKVIKEAYEEAMKRPVLTVKQAKDWNPELEKQTVQSTAISKEK